MSEFEVQVAEPSEAKKRELASSLIRAVSSGRMDATREILAKCQQENVSVDESVQGGVTALHIASRQGESPIVRLLLDHGAAVNIQAAGKDELTPLMFAASWGHTEVVSSLLAVQADPNLASVNGDSALIFAASGSHLLITRKLLNARANVNHQAQGTETALLMAAAKGNNEIVAELIEHDADVNLKSKGGVSALHFCAREGHRESAQSILAASADIDAQLHDNGWTPLMEAAHQGHLDLVKVLVLNSADTTHKSKSGRTALMLARLEKKQGVADYLATVTPSEGGLCSFGHCAVQ
eukprot:CAMPEP_0202849540 /NCGR_PEP_ID=MMETSP1389-20130828/81037_1 /ASSEMBLY_ACC=CAM_ASM_000865 /TAXON_ID=302021 /ORGANISM="Rhodomonas sp., Strain CCMP768" /LENGTH=295 /DNA_ID=CAMNT_0049527565 /DNA_START=12 /DNA_END=899 /DNA_ORIENTATION=+